MYTPSALTNNLNRNKSLPLKQATIGGQVIPSRPNMDSGKAGDQKGMLSMGAQPTISVDQLPRWNNEEIDRRLAESSKLLQEWTDLMNKTGKTS